MMNYDVYDSVIPKEVKTIQIFASASCAVNYAEGGSTDCIEHGRRLKRYFIQTRTQQHDTYVRYDVVGSTAASFSRMIKARILVCPPGTVMCLLPALGKKPGKKAYIAENPSQKLTFQWFEDHLLQERKSLGLQDEGYDAVLDEEFLDIISDVNVSMPVSVIGESDNEQVDVTDSDLDSTNSVLDGRITENRR